jgi:peptidoglycan/xylan/chitin deacetylase (PgdA/CDA1 family)
LPSKPASPGRFTLSLDFELGWGTLANGRWRAREASGVYTELRRVLPRFLDALDELAIPVTWAAVGAMVARPEELDFGHLPRALRLEREHFVETAEDATRDGRDLLDAVRSARTPHEIATHTYSHPRFGATGMTSEVRRAELGLGVTALRRWEMAPESLVFPENDATDLALVHDVGLRRARLAPILGKSGNAGPLHRGQCLLRALRPPPAVVSSADPTGVRTETGSMLLHWPLAAPRIRRHLTLARALRGTAHAVSGRAVHYWLHPFNLAEIPGLMDGLSKLLQRVARERDDGRLVVTPMGSAAPEAIPARPTA